MTRYAQLLAAAAAFIIGPGAAAETATAGTPQQFLYMLRVAPHLHDQAKWSDKDKAATARHFERLKKATADGSVILAGRTTEALDKTFGLVVFEAQDEKAAKAFMEAIRPWWPA